MTSSARYHPRHGHLRCPSPSGGRCDTPEATSHFRFRRQISLSRVSALLVVPANKIWWTSRFRRRQPQSPWHIRLNLREGGERADIAGRYLDEIHARYGSEPMQRLDAEDALRIGVHALATQDWATALLFLNQAIEKRCPRPSCIRVPVRADRKDPADWGRKPDAAIAAARNGRKDAETALELIDTREREFSRRISDLERKRGAGFTGTKASTPWK